ncbi:MAG: ComEC/Rec2 family competence protein [Actinomycetota bacterium]
MGSTHFLGEELEVTGRLIRTEEKSVAATLIASDRARIIARPSFVARFLTEVRVDFRDQLSRFGDDAGALVPGMIIGDTSLQSSTFSDRMRRAGLSHLTAVSGANFAIVSSLVFFMTRRIIPRIAPRLILTSAFLFLFLLLVRPSPSVLRAGVMAGVVLVARASGNSRSSVAALATAISLLVLIDPFQAQDPGFILSVLATSGLIFFAPLLVTKMTRFLPGVIAELIAVPCAATIACTPYLLILSGEISTLSIFFNVLVAPVVAPITILGFLSLLTMPMDLVSKALIWPAHFCAEWITTVARWSDSSPTFGVNFWLLIGGLLLVVYLFIRRAYTALFLFMIVAISNIVVPRAMFPGKEWKIVQCDVGQGDALVFNLGDSNGILFDAGPDSRLLLNCLRNIGIKELPLVVISHGHADHYFGAEGLRRSFNIGQIWSNGSTTIDNAIDFKTTKVRQGLRASIGDLTIQILWPDDGQGSFQSLGGDGSPENNRSVVALVTWDNRQILITGDIEPEVQALLSREYDLSSVEILKVPHHGSRFQDSGFLKEISPEIALVSVGVGNSYGHPNLGVLNSLKAEGAQVFRTDHDGPISVSWRFDESASRYIFTTRTWKKEWWRVQWR